MNIKSIKESLGNKFKTNKVQYRSFDEARSYVQGLGFSKSGPTGFYSWAKTDQRPSDIPDNPQVVYKKQWISWEDFLTQHYSSNYSNYYK